LKNITHNYNIAAPIGGFGNHLRWIALLDDKFRFEIEYIDERLRWINQDSWENIRSPDWPEQIAPYKLLAPKIQYRLRNVFNFEIIDSKYCNIDEKMKFIVEHVYSKKRTWQTWIHIEEKFRKQLNPLIKFSHLIPKSVKGLYITIDPELAYTTYIKLNSMNNQQSKDAAMHTTKQFNDSTCSYPERIIDGNLLFQPELDRNVYTKLITDFELDDNYLYANEIHKKWFKLHKKAEVDIVHFFYGIYN